MSAFPAMPAEGQTSTFALKNFEQINNFNDILKSYNDIKEEASNNNLLTPKDLTDLESLTNFFIPENSSNKIIDIGFIGIKSRILDRIFKDKLERLSNLSDTATNEVVKKNILDKTSLLNEALAKINTLHSSIESYQEGIEIIPGTIDITREDQLINILTATPKPEQDTTNLLCSVSKQLENARAFFEKKCPPPLFPLENSSNGDILDNIKNSDSHIRKALLSHVFSIADDNFNDLPQVPSGAAQILKSVEVLCDLRATQKNRDLPMNEKKLLCRMEDLFVAGKNTDEFSVLDQDTYFRLRDNIKTIYPIEYCRGIYSFTGCLDEKIKSFSTDLSRDNIKTDMISHLDTLLNFTKEISNESADLSILNNIESELAIIKNIVSIEIEYLIKRNEQIFSAKKLVEIALKVIPFAIKMVEEQQYLIFADFNPNTTFDSKFLSELIFQSQALPPREKKAVDQNQAQIDAFCSIFSGQAVPTQFEDDGYSKIHEPLFDLLNTFSMEEYKEEVQVLRSVIAGITFLNAELESKIRTASRKLWLLEVNRETARQVHARKVSISNTPAVVDPEPISVHQEYVEATFTYFIQTMIGSFTEKQEHLTNPSAKGCMKSSYAHFLNLMILICDLAAIPAGAEAAESELDSNSLFVDSSVNFDSLGPSSFDTTSVEPRGEAKDSSSVSTSSEAKIPAGITDTNMQSHQNYTISLVALAEANLLLEQLLTALIREHCNSEEVEDVCNSHNLLDKINTLVEVSNDFSIEAEDYTILSEINKASLSARYPTKLTSKNTHRPIDQRIMSLHKISSSELICFFDEILKLAHNLIKDESAPALPQLHTVNIPNQKPPISSDKEASSPLRTIINQLPLQDKEAPLDLIARMASLETFHKMDKTSGETAHIYYSHMNEMMVFLIEEVFKQLAVTKYSIEEHDLKSIIENDSKFKNLYLTNEQIFFLEKARVTLYKVRYSNLDDYRRSDLQLAALHRNAEYCFLDRIYQENDPDNDFTPILDPNRKNNNMYLKQKEEAISSVEVDLKTTHDILQALVSMYDGSAE